MQSDEELGLDESIGDSEISDGTSLSEIEADSSDWSWSSREQRESSDESPPPKVRSAYSNPTQPSTR